MDIQLLRLEQLDRALKQIQVPPRPKAGWVHAVRSALGMTTRQLAERLGVTQSTVTSLEKSEANDKISLHTLRRAAEALDCELHYVLVPRESLGKRVDQQADRIARDMVNRVSHTMHLEDQGSSAAFGQLSMQQVKAQILKDRWKKLWQT